MDVKEDFYEELSGVMRELLDDAETLADVLNHDGAKVVMEMRLTVDTDQGGYAKVPFRADAYISRGEWFGSQKAAHEHSRLESEAAWESKTQEEKDAVFAEIEKMGKPTVK